MNKFIQFTGLLIASSILFSCGENTPKPVAHSWLVKRETVHKALFFTGTIQPLQESTVGSPIDATLETIHYHYGQTVKKGEVIFTLNSYELQKQFNETLTEYLKAKDSFTIARTKFDGTNDLWQAGLISKNNFLSEKSGLDTARVSFMQSSRKLTEILEKIDSRDKQDLSALNIADFAKVRQALASKHNIIQLKASASGILLYPPRAGEEKTGRITVGSVIKSGQVLALIGDLSGVRIEIDIPEIDIDKIRPGMKAKITGIALGKQVLTGELVAVNAQATAANGGALPSFSAIVEVKKMSGLQQSLIKIGMSTTIELNAEHAAQLLVPVNAVRREQGASIVTVRLADGSLDNKVVSTGTAQADKVIIESGLQEGDTVVYG